MAIHKMMGSIIEYSLDNQDMQNNISIIGAGGCALPNYLMRKFSNRPKPFPLRIACVEPDVQVLRVAQDFFGTVFSTDNVHGLFKYAQNGADFFEEQRDINGRSDVVILDAFETKNTSTLKQVHLAPSPDLLQVKNLENLLYALSGDANGLLVANLLGPQEWIEIVRNSIQKTKIKDNSGEMVKFSEPVILSILGKGISNCVLIATTGKEKEKMIDQLKMMIHNTSDKKTIFI